MNIKIQKLYQEHSSTFWNFNKTTKQEVFGVSKKSDGSLATLPNALNDQFCSLFTKEDLSDKPTYKSNDIPDTTEIVVTVPGVLKLLTNIKPNKATGPDEIPGEILLEYAESVAQVLSKIFNKSLSTGSLPDDWLNVNVSPLFKKGDRSNPANYRPISPTSITCRLLEHIILHHIMCHLEQHHVFLTSSMGLEKGFPVKLNSPVLQRL